MTSKLFRSSFSGSQVVILFVATFVVLGFIAHAQQVSVPFEFQPGDTARSSEVNENFSVLADAISALPLPADEIHVSLEGAPFTSVADALNSITLATADRPFLVVVHPGVYDETEICRVQSFVHLLGSGMGTTVIRGSREASLDSEDAAIVVVEDGARVSSLTVENQGTFDGSVAVRSVDTSRDTVLYRVEGRAVTTGGSEHSGIFLRDTNLLLEECTFRAQGASSRNAALRCTDNGGPFAQPLLRDCTLVGNGVPNGVGLDLDTTALTARGCRIEGQFRPIRVQSQGISVINSCRVQSLGLSPLMEQTGSAVVLSGGNYFIGGNPIGLSSQFKYVHCIKSNHDPVVNGFGSNLTP